MKNCKYSIRKYQCGWIVTRKTDDFQIYFENYDELLDFIK